MEQTSTIKHKYKKSVGGLFAAVFLAATLSFAGAGAALAENVDPLGGNGGSGNTQQSEEGPSYEDIQKQLQNQNSNVEPDNSGTVEDPTGINGSPGGDFIKNYQPLTDYNPSDSPILMGVLDFVGKVTSFLIWLVVALTFLVTAFDLLYILVPFVRPWLADANEDGQGNSMGGGFGGGMGGMMGGANASAQKKSIMNRQWVSDEAINAVKSLGGSAQSQTSGGMGGGMGGFGGGFGGGMGSMGMAPDQEANTKKTVLGDYFKKRIVVLFILGIAIVILTGSTVMGFGMDLGTWLVQTIASWIATWRGTSIDFG